MAFVRVLPAVLLAAGDVIEIDGEEHAVKSRKRVENGPTQLVETDRITFEVGAARPIRIVSLAGTQK